MWGGGGGGQGIQPITLVETEIKCMLLQKRKKRRQRERGGERKVPIPKHQQIFAALFPHFQSKPFQNYTPLIVFLYIHTCGPTIHSIATNIRGYGLGERGRGEERKLDGKGKM